MDDLVEQGRRDPAARSGRLRSVAALLLGTGLVALALARADMGGPAPAPPDGGPANAGDTGGEGVVVRQDDRLERYVVGRRLRLATLPRDLPPAARIVPAGGPRGSGPLVSAARTVLFRASAATADPVVAIGRAVRVLGPARAPGDVFVLRRFGGDLGRRRVVEVDGRSGSVVAGEPFPGFTDRSRWVPVELLRVTDAVALLLRRPSGRGRIELALAWPRHRVLSGASPPRQAIGRFGDLLGVAGGRVLAVDQAAAACPDGAGQPPCPLRVVTVTRDRVLSRPVGPPPGWRFAGRAIADGADPLAVVSRTGDPTTRALARLVVGGNQALLVPGSTGVLPSAGLVGAEGGSVVFALAGPESGARLAAWEPQHPDRASPLDLPALRDGARIVCRCR